LKFATVVLLISLSGLMLSARQNDTKASAEPPCPSSEGVYYLDGLAWKPMERITISERVRKTNPLPFTKQKMLAQYPGASAGITVGASPKFCIFGADQATAKILMIASLEVKGDHREMVSHSSRSLSTTSRSGVPEDQLQPTEVKRTADKSFEISTTNQLPPGQYLLFARSPNMGYDFGVGSSAQ
jgi:hypothetical protein